MKTTWAAATAAADDAAATAAAADDDDGIGVDVVDNGGGVGRNVGPGADVGGIVCGKLLTRVNVAGNEAEAVSCGWCALC